MYEKDELFATLGTSVGKLRLPREMYFDEEGHFIQRSDILIYDTIGFIRDLPPDLIDAFSSTLEESLSCDLLLHVVDASDPHIDDRITVTHDILRRIGIVQPCITIFNQIDRAVDIVSLRDTYTDLDPVFVSAKTGEGIEELKRILLQKQVESHQNL